MVDSNTAPQATIVIVTKNRKDDLRRALKSAFAQNGNIEVLVFDDASTDGTPDVVRSEFPQAKLHLNEVSTGHIGHRNRGVEMASAPFVVIIDDDAALESPDTVLHTIGEFNDPAIGAVAIPFIDDGKDFVRQRAPDEAQIWTTFKFIGAAHALRKDAFLKVGGYRTELVHFGEEADLCARLLAAGYVTRLGTATPARHYLSPIRNKLWERYYAARAGIVTSYMNPPLPLVPLLLTAWTIREPLLIFRHGNAWPTFRGIAGGYRDIIRHANKRRGLSWPVYKMLREMKQRNAIPLEEVRSRLPHIIR